MTPWRQEMGELSPLLGEGGSTHLLRLYPSTSFLNIKRTVLHLTLLFLPTLSSSLQASQGHQYLKLPSHGFQPSCNWQEPPGDSLSLCQPHATKLQIKRPSWNFCLIPPIPLGPILSHFRRGMELEVWIWEGGGKGAHHQSWCLYAPERCACPTMQLKSSPKHHPPQIQ